MSLHEDQQQRHVSSNNLARQHTDVTVCTKAKGRAGWVPQKGQIIPQTICFLMSVSHGRGSWLQMTLTLPRRASRSAEGSEVKRLLLRKAITFFTAGGSSCEAVPRVPAWSCMSKSPKDLVSVPCNVPRSHGQSNQQVTFSLCSSQAHYTVVKWEEFFALLQKDQDPDFCLKLI